jgi:hypothetical protein
MMRSTFALVLVLAGGLVVTACSKKKEESADSTTAAADTAAPADTGTATAAETAAPAASDSAAPADTGAPAASGSASAPPAETAAPVANTGTLGIENCCAALARVATRARGKKTKTKSFRALEVCPGIAAQVRAGRATRAAGLAQVRSALTGAPVPAACR